MEVIVWYRYAERAFGRHTTPGGTSKSDNANMVKHLTPMQKEVYQQAQLEHRLNAAKFARIMAGMRAELVV